MRKFPANSTTKSNETIFCFAYDSDLNQAYAFYCARYKLISYNEFLNLGLAEFQKLFNSIPKSEPLYEIIKSRVIKPGTIKDKNERKYWQQLKRINTIPGIYISNKELDLRAKKQIGKLGGIKNG